MHVFIARPLGGWLPNDDVLWSQKAVRGLESVTMRNFMNRRKEENRKEREEIAT